MKDLKELKKQSNQVICCIIKNIVLYILKKLQLWKTELIPVNFILKFQQ